MKPGMGIDVGIGICIDMDGGMVDVDMDAGIDVGTAEGGNMPVCSCRICILSTARGTRFEGPLGPFFLGIAKYVHANEVELQLRHGCLPSLGNVSHRVRRAEL